MNSNRYSALRNAALASATGRLNLGVCAFSVLVSVTTATLDLGGQLLPGVTLFLGVSAYLALVAMDLRSPEFIQRANRSPPNVAPPGEPLLKPAELADPVIRTIYTAVLESLEKCRRAYASGSQGLQDSLSEGMSRANDLAQVASRAARRSSAIYRHLQADSPEGLAKELAKLQQLAQATGDATAKRDFEQASAAKARELETYGQLQALRDRVHAQLQLIETSLDGLSAKLVKIDATDLHEALSINESLADNLRTMTSDVEILESTYDETMLELRA